MFAWKVDPFTKDLVFEGGSPVLIDGVKKLEQDVRWAIIEPLGNDRFNPNWGSSIPLMIGEPFDPATLSSEVEVEVVNTLRKYHEQILATLEKWRFTGIPGQMQTVTLFALGEMIAEVGQIRVMMLRQDRRSAAFQVELTTERGERVRVVGVTGATEGVTLGNSN